MKVLITGGMGVNGAVTARLLVKEGLRPVLLDNRMDWSLMQDIKNNVDCVEADVCDQGAVEKIVDDYGVTHIAHLAALMPGPAEANPRLGIRVGVDGTVNILEVARAKKIKRVVFTSSKAVYGEILGDCAPPTCKPVREDHPKQPADMYGTIKVCCEQIGKYYREMYGIEFIALRYVSIYGPGKEARHGPLSFYGQLIEKSAPRRKMGGPPGRRPAQRRGLCRRCGSLHLSGAQGGDAGRVGIQHRNGQDLYAARFFECGGKNVSAPSNRVGSGSEPAGAEQAELLCF